MMNMELKDAVVNYLMYLRESGQTHLSMSADTIQILKYQAKAFSLNKPTSSVNRKLDQEPRSAAVTTSVESFARENSKRASSVVTNLSGSEKAQRLETLAHTIKKCSTCSEYFKNYRNFIFGAGNFEAELVFVGEAPGIEEDEEGQPFVGKAGQILTKMILAMGLTREQVYLTTLVKFKPDMPKGSLQVRKPTMDEIKVSLPYLLAQIEIIKPKVIISLGATVTEALLKLDSNSAVAQRGVWNEIDGMMILPTFHPGYLLTHTSNEDKRLAWEDLLKVMKQIQLPISEKQLSYFLKK